MSSIGQMRKDNNGVISSELLLKKNLN